VISTASKANAIITKLIDAAVELKLRTQIKVSFFFGWSIPIALTGHALPFPYSEVFYGAGSALAVLGVGALFASLFMK
jgi:hypothetical protein